MSPSPREWWLEQPGWWCNMLVMQVIVLHPNTKLKFITWYTKDRTDFLSGINKFSDLQVRKVVNGGRWYDCTIGEWPATAIHTKQIVRSIVVNSSVNLRAVVVQRIVNRLSWPLTSKWGHGWRASWDSFLPIFSYLCPSVLDLGSGTGQTDGQTSAINA